MAEAVSVAVSVVLVLTFTEEGAFTSFVFDVGRMEFETDTAIAATREGVGLDDMGGGFALTVVGLDDMAGGLTLPVGWGGVTSLSSASSVVAVASSTLAAKGVIGFNCNTPSSNCPTLRHPHDSATASLTPMENVRQIWGVMPICTAFSLGVAEALDEDEADDAAGSCDCDCSVVMLPFGMVALSWMLICFCAWVGFFFIGLLSFVLLLLVVGFRFF